MPTYDYQCDACDHAFELFQGINDPKKKKCPECGKPKLRRLIGTGAAIVFKGSGFYQTDYRSDKYKKAAEADKSSGESSSADSSKTSEKGKEPAATSSKSKKSGSANSKKKNSSSE